MTSTSDASSHQFLPMTRDEMLARGWDSVDIVLVTGDAYVDHPSFAAAVIGRVLEAEQLRVAILSQPDWKDCEAWKTFGEPRLAFCISAGNVDSMVNHYTASRKRRNDDAYSPAGLGGLRPDRATSVYAQRAREAFQGVPIIIGGIEASLRRISHYDFWSDKVRRSIIFDSKADLLVYGNGETAIREVVQSLQRGEAIRTIRNVRGTAYRIGASEDIPEETPETVYLPSHEEVAEDSDAGRRFFVAMTNAVYSNANPYSAATLVQQFDQEAVVINPPSLPLSQDAMDQIASLPFVRRPHPSYAKSPIPAFTVVRDSIISHRGCFGGCAFCSLTLHQGKVIQSRSEGSILAEVAAVVANSASRGVVSDIGGPSANMYKLGCTDNERRKVCQRLSCLVPKRCEKLSTDHHAIITLMKKAREQDGVKAVFIASGVRTDLALCDEHYIDEIVGHHVGGHLKTAPEHTDPRVLALINKPAIESHNDFTRAFFASAARHGRELYLVPYLMAGLPGATLSSMVNVAEFLMRERIRPEQVQDFIPTPMTLATCMYYTGLNPINGERVITEKGLRGRRLQKALLLYYDPAFYHDVKSALKEAQREDLIGVLIPKYPSKEQAIRQSSRVKRLQMQQLAKKRLEEAQREEDRLAREKVAEERAASRERPRYGRPFERRESRGEWRPREDRPRGERSFGAGGRSGERREARGEWRPREDRPRDDRPRGDRPFGGGDRPRNDRPRDDRPRGDRPFGGGGDRPRSDRPRDDRPRGDRPFGGGGDRPRSDRPRDDRPRGDRPFGGGGDRPRSDRPRDDRPRGDRPFGGGGDRPRNDRPRDDRPRGDRPFGGGGDRPRSDRPRDDRPRGDRPFGGGGDRPRSDRPRDDRPRGDRPFGGGGDRPRSDRPRDDRPRGDRPFGGGGDRPRNDRPRDDRSRGDRPFGGGGDRPRSDRPRDDRPRGDRPFGGGDRPRGDRPFGGGGDRPRNDRPRDDRPRGDRPFGGGGDRPRSDRPRDDRPRGDRPFGGGGNRPRSSGPPRDGSPRRDNP
ncbi:MAG: YgiQ family radical SAM protein [Thermoguttaceae bacterium]